MQEFTISNGYFYLWNTYLKEKGIDWQTLNLSEIQTRQVQNILSASIDAQSSLDLFIELLEITETRLHVTNLALEMAACITPANFGVLGYMASRSDTLGQVVEYIAKFHRLVIDGAQVVPIQIEQDASKIRLYWPLVDDSNILLSELTLAAMVQLAKQIAPVHEFLLQHVEFVHRARGAVVHYQRFFQCKLSFERPYYALTFASESLNVRPQHADPTLVQLLVKQAEEALVQRKIHADLVQQIHWIVQEYFKHKQQAPKIEDIAIELNVSVRSLQRQLQALNTSFKLILDAERMKRCEILLRQNESLTAIADQLGYSDQSALARAYKNLTGQTLLTRKKQLQLIQKNATK
ncbi:TPA: helix-turn-helix domain-containing protein [Acinetobacter baumannii]|uniref:AraC family transcriptional regulator n=1 Tax=Acinetobacter baumannii TaxID=470 RepID=UPI00035583EE|nr:AraC family transcriptional regulator [Acinetobacter baumannii]AGQ07916.1 AraC-type DNA-binding domain-containing protein [Acinetobacter baumannii BJAB0715]AMN02827.1 AraC family transcriptional regulator [Acinetobacter baumannii]EHZ7610885.1 AraC family transcriptional regulator ligand-binding domain-containing protein [Acinetobacter baumannii]EJX0974894.1 AraC family transcriptional regulator ligand-binding domain-containing protein [Acinetobacter baumannii]EKD2866129.1 AraC family transc